MFFIVIFCDYVIVAVINAVIVLKIFAKLQIKFKNAKYILN